jgi:ligand-binding sensor domain-containing protein
VRILYLIITIFIISGHSRAQSPSFTNFSTKDGLSSAQVYSIFQDINGDILFATDRGITQYNGYNFETFSTSDGLTNTTVFDFFPQPNGEVWCSTIDNSWFLFKNGTTLFRPYQNNKLIQKESRGGLAEDLWINNDDIYIGFNDHTDYLHINSNTQEVVHPISIPQGKMKPDSIEAVFVFKNHRVFKYHQFMSAIRAEWTNQTTRRVAQDYSKSGYKKSAFINGKFIFTTNTTLLISSEQADRTEIIIESKIIGLGKLDDKHFWIGLLEGGVRIFDMQGNEIQQWLTENSPTDLIKDKDGGIWVSTLDNGVFYAQNDYITQYQIDENDFILSISPGINNAPLISTLSNHYQVYEKQFNLLSLDPTTSSQRVFYNFQSSKYISSINSYFIKNKRIQTGKAGIIDFSENNELKPLIAGPFAFYTYSKGQYRGVLLKTRLKAIEHANDGVLYGGYFGLHYYSFKTSSTTKIEFQPLQGRITDIKKKGNYHFIGTNESGLVRFNQIKNEILTITEEHGLASNLINEVYVESDSIIWIATNHGLDRIVFIGDDYDIDHIGIEDGLPENDISDVYIHNNLIWIGTRSGLFSIPKSKFNKKSHYTSLNLFWSKITTSKQVLIQPSKITLESDNNNLELEFHSAFFGGGSRVKYRYKIYPSNNQWHTITGRKIFLNGLQPGKYNIILQASIDQTNWSDNQISLAVTIAPPFHQTWWFRTVIGSFIILMLYLFFKLRVLIYNRTLVRELLRLIIRKINPQTKSFIIHEQGEKHRINSADVLYLNSNGNYLTINLKERKFSTRHTIGEFDQLVPDKIEYLRVHKSYVVRIDKITGKNNDLIFLGNHEVPIGKTYKKALREMSF